MLQESDLIPYSTSNLPEGPWLVFAPHADDETFGMGGSLLLASDQQIETHVVVLTDGALGGASGHELVATRRKEAKAAAEYLGAASLTFWDLPDRGIKICSATISRATDTVATRRPHSIFFPSPMEIHPDHRATAQLVWEGIRRFSGFSGKAIAYEIGVQAQINALIDISPVAERKRKAMGFYKSQLTENNYIEVVQGLDRARTYTLSQEVSAAEGFYIHGNCVSDLNESTRDVLRPYWTSDSSDLVLKQHQSAAQAWYRKLPFL